ncbi:MAG: Tm-1-like ATP-binding domain-containing protein [Pirellulales bacterium]
MPVLLIGTLDTKGREIDFVRDLLAAGGAEVTVIDAGCLGEPAIAADVTRQAVFEAVGTSLDAVRGAGDRGKAIELAAEGVRRIALELHQRGEVEGLLGLGGSAGTIIATSAMRALPFGIPKLMVSTLASGQTRPYVGVRDVMMLNSVVDLAGINRISRTVLANAAGAMLGMLGLDSAKAARAARSAGGEADRPLVAATMFGVTTPCVEAARAILEQAGYEVLVFHATGTGGQAMESLVADDLVAGVLDVTTTELADELIGGVLSAGPDRLTVAAQHGVPQVVVPGALDMVNFGPRDTVPPQFQKRTFYQHNPAVTLMRTTPEENRTLAEEIARKTAAATGPVAILLPLGGVSAIDRAGQPFADPEADAALFDALRANVAGNVELVELDLHINDPAFARAAAEKLLELIGRGASQPSERAPGK